MPNHSDDPTSHTQDGQPHTVVTAGSVYRLEGPGRGSDKGWVRLPPSGPRTAGVGLEEAGLSERRRGRGRDRMLFLWMVWVAIIRNRMPQNTAATHNFLFSSMMGGTG